MEFETEWFIRVFLGVWVLNTEITGFVFFQERLSYSNAQTRCQSIGSTLAKIDSSQKYNELAAFFSAGNPSYDFWIGLKLDESSYPPYNYLYEDGTTATYFNWYAFEPNDQDTDKCIRLEKNYLQFRTIHCSRSYYVLCDDEGSKSTMPSTLDTTTINIPTSISTSTYSTSTVKLSSPSTKISSRTTTTDTTTDLQRTHLMPTSQSQTEAEESTTVETSKTTKDESLSTSSTENWASSTGLTGIKSQSTSSISMSQSQTDLEISTSSVTSQTTVGRDVVTSPCGDSMVICSCVQYNFSDPDFQRELQTKIDGLKKTLVLESKLLTKAKIRLISAPDQRVSSRFIGAVGGIILATVLLLLVLPDIINVYKFFSKRKRNI